MVIKIFYWLSCRNQKIVWTVSVGINWAVLYQVFNSLFFSAAFTIWERYISSHKKVKTPSAVRPNSIKCRPDSSWFIKVPWFACNAWHIPVGRSGLLLPFFFLPLNLVEVFFNESFWYTNSTIVSKTICTISLAPEYASITEKEISILSTN